MGGPRIITGYAALLLSALAACGGRAMLDSDEVGVDQAGSGSTFGTAGAKNGTSGGPGAGGKTGASSATDDACRKYCSLQARALWCIEPYVECTPSCSREFARRSRKCQERALSMVDCLVGAYQRSQDCQTAEPSARDQ